MIVIDKERQMLVMYTDTEGNTSKSIKEKQNDEIFEFPLISGYTCPECKRVLRAYYIGVPRHLALRVSNPFREDSNYDRGIPPIYHKEGTSKDGSYYYIQSHERHCKLYVFEYRGIRNALLSFIKTFNKDQNPFTPQQIDILTERIANNQLPGAQAIYDVCKVDEPLLGFHGEKAGTFNSSTYFGENIVKYLTMYARPELPVLEGNETKISDNTSIATSEIETSISTE